MTGNRPPRPRNPRYGLKTFREIFSLILRTVAVRGAGRLILATTD
jgi:hypothetical protein